MKSLEEPKESKTCHDFYRGLQIDVRNFSISTSFLALARLLFHSVFQTSSVFRILFPFVSKLLLLCRAMIESVYSNFYVITFQYFHLYFFIFGGKICIKFQNFSAGSKTERLSLISPLLLRLLTSVKWDAFKTISLHQHIWGEWLLMKITDVVLPPKHL